MGYRSMRRLEENNSYEAPTLGKRSSTQTVSQPSWFIKSFKAIRPSASEKRPASAAMLEPDPVRPI